MWDPLPGRPRWGNPGSVSSNTSPVMALKPDQPLPRKQRDVNPAVVDDLVIKNSATIDLWERKGPRDRRTESRWSPSGSGSPTRRRRDAGVSTDADTDTEDDDKGLEEEGLDKKSFLRTSPYVRSRLGVPIRPPVRPWRGRAT